MSELDRVTPRPVAGSPAAVIDGTYRPRVRRTGLRPGTAAGNVQTPF